MDTTSPTYQYGRVAGRASFMRELRAALNADTVPALPPAAYAVLNAFEARVNAESDAAMDSISPYPADSPTEARLLAERLA